MAAASVEVKAKAVVITAAGIAAIATAVPEVVASINAVGCTMAAVEATMVVPAVGTTTRGIAAIGAATEGVAAVGAGTTGTAPGGARVVRATIIAKAAAMTFAYNVVAAEAAITAPSTKVGKAEASAVSAARVGHPIQAISCAAVNGLGALDAVGEVGIVASVAAPSEAIAEIQVTTEPGHSLALRPRRRRAVAAVVVAVPARLRPRRCGSGSPGSASASASVYGAKATAGAMLPGDSRSARTPRQLRCSRLIATTAICSPRCSTIGRERSRSRTPGPSRCSSWAWSRTIWTFTDLPWRSKLSSPCVCPRLSRGSRRAASRRSSVRSCLPSGSLCWSSLGASFPSALSASRAATRRPSASLACSSPTDEKQKQLRRTWRIPRAFMYPNVTSVLPVPAEPQTWSVAEVGGFEAPSPRSDQRRRTCEARAGPQRRSRGSRRWREAAGAPQASSSAWKAASSAAEAGGSSARTTGSVLVGALTTAAFAPAAFAPSAFGPSGLRSASFRRAISWTLLP
mmetsp:Transcript_5118/g.15090  ORF Transcript_5118/g.15090 Transcript_5118/m.15090 type:complete len:514 (-) Transcript_5118:404-1945(-)